MRCAICKSIPRLQFATGKLSIALGLVLLGGISGCSNNNFHVPDSLAFWRKESEADYTSATHAVTYRDGQMIIDPSMKVIGGDFEGARQLFGNKEYAKAESIFGDVADSKKNTFQIAEEARYYQAECLYKQGMYPGAADRYMQLLNEFIRCTHGDECRQRLFDIANYWLDETRDQMEQAQEVRDGKRWFATPIAPVHFETSKPFLDIEGRAVKLLEAVHMTDPEGPLADKALFYVGSVKFYREDYRDADHYFSQIKSMRRQSSLKPKAVQLSIICKLLSTYGADYDGRRMQEARDLIQSARTAFPELQQTQGPWLTKQMVEINNLQAEKDFNVARFYERTGHPGSAHFYYEIVRRRYPGTTFAEQSDKKLVELRASALREANSAAQAGPAPEPGPAPQPFLPGQPSRAPAPFEAGPAPRMLPPTVESPR